MTLRTQHWATLVPLLLSACTDAPLQAVQKDGPPPVDDKLALTGEICTQIPDDAFFPVKIMFVIDTSFTMRVTDPAQQRVQAVQDVIDRYAGNPSVEFSVVAFDAVVSDVTDGFTSNPNLGRVSSRLSDSDRLTDYQGSLGAAYNILTQDMLASSPAERARSKYVVIFFSDGTPDPQCFLDGPQLFQNVCTVDRDEWPDAFELPPGTNPNTGEDWTWEDFQGLYPELEAGKDYNTPEQLSLLVEDILELQEIYNVSEVRFHTAFLFDPNVDQAFIDSFGLNRQAGIDLLTTMAEAGNGTFTEFTGGGEISFLNVNYSSVKQTYAMTNFIVFNESAHPMAEGKVPDSDGDGLPDSVEDDLRLCSYERGGANCNLGDGNFRDALDSDDDGFSDLFEVRFQSSGFDPAVQNEQLGACRSRDDSDGDGLLDCEEVFLQTDPRLLDTDRDRIPDGVEIRFGLDPLDTRDAVADNDADGTLNGEELLIQWTPLVREPIFDAPPRYEYTVTSLGETPDGRNCYAYSIENIELETTRAINPANRGLNTVRLFFMEGPPDDPRDFGVARTACVQARYVAPDLKVPAHGRIELLESDFYPPTEIDIPCVGPGPRPEPDDAPEEEGMGDEDDDQ